MDLTLSEHQSIQLCAAKNRLPYEGYMETSKDKLRKN